MPRFQENPQMINDLIIWEIFKILKLYHPKISKGIWESREFPKCLGIWEIPEIP